MILTDGFRKVTFAFLISTAQTHNEKDRKYQRPQSEIKRSNSYISSDNYRMFFSMVVWLWWLTILFGHFSVSPKLISTSSSVSEQHPVWNCVFKIGFQHFMALPYCSLEFPPFFPQCVHLMRGKHQRTFREHLLLLSVAFWAVKKVQTLSSRRYLDLCFSFFPFFSHYHLPCPDHIHRERRGPRLGRDPSGNSDQSETSTKDWVFFYSWLCSPPFSTRIWRCWKSARQCTAKRCKVLCIFFKSPTKNISFFWAASKSSRYLAW